ncbi:hypothetical protein A3Q56_04185 [Intoshia linei]|uniref:Uncharacterized protein n=1 Tax=Intoshia linei TaxID=1819745 RepID=A0A177B1A3_9BILA|nr:hypothetical protein A3Q56_04185 [Intoshia linei]
MIYVRQKNDKRSRLNVEGVLRYAFFSTQPYILELSKK